MIYTKPDIKRPVVIPMYSSVPVFIIRNLLRTAWRYIRIASVAMTLLSEGMWTYRIQRERDESAGRSTGGAADGYSLGTIERLYLVPFIFTFIPSLRSTNCWREIGLLILLLTGGFCAAAPCRADKYSWQPRF